MQVLQAIVTGGIWHGSRLEEFTGNPEAGICSRCGERMETPLHRYWLCKANHELAATTPAIRRTQHLSDLARAEGAERPCLWYRGLLPRRDMEFALDEQCTWSVHCTVEAGCTTATELYTDGSGSTADPRWRRCGWAACWLDRDLDEASDRDDNQEAECLTHLDAEYQGGLPDHPEAAIAERHREDAHPPTNLDTDEDVFGFGGGLDEYPDSPPGQAHQQQTQQGEQSSDLAGSSMGVLVAVHRTVKGLDSPLEPASRDLQEHHTNDPPRPASGSPTRRLTQLHPADQPGADTDNFALGVRWKLGGAVYGRLGCHERHTVARAELLAVLHAILASSARELKVYSDCMYVVMGMKKDLRCKQVHQDVWNEIAQATEGRSVHVIWLKAHIRNHAEYVKYKMTPKHLTGNFIADGLAKRGAELAVDQRSLDAAQRNAERATAIRERLLAIDMHIISNAPKQRDFGKAFEAAPREPRAARLRRLIAASGHALVVKNGRRCCRHCNRHTSESRLVSWLSAGPCRGPTDVKPCASRLPMPLPSPLVKYIEPAAEIPSTIHEHDPRPAHCNHQVQLGTRLSHSSHHLAKYKGLVWCWRCGCTGSYKQAVGLCRPCNERPISLTKQQILNRLRSGKPHKGQEWPDPRDEGPFPMIPAE